jgi:hypothetical protein
MSVCIRISFHIHVHVCVCDSPFPGLCPCACVFPCLCSWLCKWQRHKLALVNFDLAVSLKQLIFDSAVYLIPLSFDLGVSLIQLRAQGDLAFVFLKEKRQMSRQIHRRFKNILECDRCPKGRCFITKKNYKFHKTVPLIKEQKMRHVIC